MISGPDQHADRPLWLRILGIPITILIALVLVVEEWLWRPLLAVMEVLGRLPLVHIAEHHVSRLRPWPALLLFALPALALLPFKFVGVYLLSNGHRVMGVTIFFIAKLVGTALVARLFSLTEPRLRKLPWFARLLDGFLRLRRQVYDRVFGNRVVRLARVAVRRVTSGVRRALGWLRRALASSG